MWTHFLIVFLSLLVSRGEGKSTNAEVTHWGLIVAGSNSWYNYRHQVSYCVHCVQDILSVHAKNLVNSWKCDFANRDLLTSSLFLVCRGLVHFKFIFCLHII